MKYQSNVVKNYIKSTNYEINNNLIELSITHNKKYQSNVVKTTLNLQIKKLITILLNYPSHIIRKHPILKASTCECADSVVYKSRQIVRYIISDSLNVLYL